jgi:hypothetical protein
MRDPGEDDEAVPQVVPQRLEVYQDPLGHWKSGIKGGRYRGQLIVV